MQSSPTLVIINPTNGASFYVGADLTITADTADTDGVVSRVDFFAGSTLLGTVTPVTSNLVSITWSDASAGNYVLTAKATDDDGAMTLSSPVNLTVANLRADVAIVRNFSDPEIDTMQDYLFDLGLTWHVFDQEGLTFRVLTNFSLIIWDNLGTTNQGLTDKEVNLFQRLYDVDLPLYFIGERLAASTLSLTPPYRSQWTALTHLNATATPGGDGTVTILSEPRHPIINGQFGLVQDFAYPATVDATTATGTGEILCGQSGGWDVLLASENPPDTGERTVTQNVQAVKGADEESMAERKILFENAVWWLFRKPSCRAIDMSITMVGLPDPVAVGQPLVYAMTVKQGGECDGTGVTVTDTLPPGVTFVTAATSRGSWTETNGVVKFNLGFFTQGASADLSVTVAPTVAGSITNTARVRSNEPDVRPINNVASVETTVTGMGPHFAQSPGTYGSVTGSARHWLLAGLGSPLLISPGVLLESGRSPN